jgi:hypothetical protein
MADIIERLREPEGRARTMLAGEDGLRDPIKLEAADEIEALRKRVAELEAVVLAEREACAKVCDGLADTAGEELYYRAYIDAAAQIRARGEGK